MRDGTENARENIGKRQMKGAIFDLDGTLLDSMPIYDTAGGDTLRALGYTPRAGLYDALRTLSGNEVLEYFHREYDTRETIAELEAALDKQLERFYADTAPLKPGVARLLEALRGLGIPMAVATATRRIHVEAALERTGAAKYFSRIFTCPEENTGKREPTIFLRAAEFLGTAPGETYVFEDSLHAIKSAKSAGFYVVAFYDGSERNNQAGIRELADEYYDSPAGFEISQGGGGL
jgi:HAD superfamily hydrolase (TIGR01509 family)